MKKLTEKLREKNINELKDLLKETDKELADLKIKLATRKLKNTKLAGTKRKEIARILTLIREKDLGL